MGSGFSRTKEGTKGIPPGPWNPISILGISQNPAEVLTGWSKIYGPVYSFKMFAAPLTVVLNNYAVIREACIDNADALPYRVTSPLRHYWGIRGRLLYCQGEEQKTIREFVRCGLKHFQDRVLFVRVSEEARHLCEAFAKEDGQSIEPTHLLSLASGNMMTVLNFGKRYDYDDPIIIEIMENFDHLYYLLRPDNLVQQFPSLLNTFVYKQLKYSHEWIRDFICQEIKEHKSTLDRSNPRDCIDLYLMRIEDEGDQGPDPLFDVDRAWFTIKDIFSSASNPTACGLQWLIALICQYQDEQEKIYEEVMAVIGKERLPAVEDVEKMPYTHAFMAEVLRFRSPVPLANRDVHSDLVVDGYFIPNGSRVYFNFYAAARDPDWWNKPDEFIPERFLSPDGKTVIKPNHYIPLGIGHRDCMGQKLAMMEMFFFGVNLVQKFHLQFDPNEPPPSLRGVCGTTLVMEKFKLCAIKRE